MPLLFKEVESFLFSSLSNHPAYNWVLKNTLGWKKNVTLQFKPLVIWSIDNRLTKSLGTCNTNLSVRYGVRLMVPYPTMVVSVPSATLIFWCLEHRLCVVKRVKEWVMWSMALELMIQGWEQQSCETLREWEIIYLLDCAKE